MKKLLHHTFGMLTLLILVILMSSAFAENASVIHAFKSADEALKYINNEHPSQLNIGSVKYSPSQIQSIKEAMPDNSIFQFSTTWCGETITNDSTEVNFNNGKSKVTVNDLEAVIYITPSIRKITVSKHRNLSNKEMIPLIEKYPEIDFVWLINFAHEYTCPSDATAYSTMKPATRGYRLKSSDLEPLKYAKNLKAIDFGHHDITTLDFLKGLDLELVILGDNMIEDISVLGEMPHLQYAELFMNRITDISPLANCEALLDLNLTGNYVTDLSPLDACNMLERLWSSRNIPMEQETQQHFIRQHPSCEADFTAYHATADGWRQHPRYKHYIACFKSLTWTSFNEETEK